MITEEFIDDVIAAVRQRKDGRTDKFPYEILEHKYHWRRVLNLMDKLSDAGILEYGVSLRTGWIQDYDPDIEQKIAEFKRRRGIKPAPCGCLEDES